MFEDPLVKELVIRTACILLGFMFGMLVMGLCAMAAISDERAERGLFKLEEEGAVRVRLHGVMDE
jgi:hypothetical protein